MAFFHLVAKKIAEVVGSSWAFAISLLSIVVWLILGPFYQYSDTWQLVVNTATSVITFLMVFIFQNTQNRDTQCIDIKLDVLIRVHKMSHNSLIDLEKLTDSQIKELEKKYKDICEDCEEDIQNLKSVEEEKAEKKE
jgi:low affinity Fe/Cu permease